MAAACALGTGDDVGALPPTAAAQPPPLDTAGAVELPSSAGSAATAATEGPSPFQALPPPPLGGGFEESDAPQPESADVLAVAACCSIHSGGEKRRARQRWRARKTEIENHRGGGIEKQTGCGEKER